MTKLKIETLAKNTQACYENSRDLRFSQEQRNEWLIKGFEQKARLMEVIGQEFSASVEQKVIQANTQLKTINERLQNKEESLKEYADTVQKITDVVAILDIIIGLPIAV